MIEPVVVDNSSSCLAQGDFVSFVLCTFASTLHAAFYRAITPLNNMQYVWPAAKHYIHLSIENKVLG